MHKQVIRSGVPETGGPINIAVRHGDMVYISGLPPFTPEFAAAMQAARREGRPLPAFPDIPFEQQVRIVMDAMQAIMDAAGSSMDHLLKVVVWLKDQSQQEVFDRIYREYFTGPETWPARTRMQAGRTPLGMGLEVDAIGYVPGRPRRAPAKARSSGASRGRAAARPRTRAAGKANAAKAAPRRRRGARP